MSDSTLTAPPRRRLFSFRLSTMLLLVVIIALGVAQFQATREVLQTREADRLLREENAKLRAEAGYLAVEDPTKVSVLQLQTLDPMTWRWKVYLPKGDWTVCAAMQQIPVEGLVEPQSQIWTSAEKQILVEASVRKGVDGELQLVNRVSGPTSSSTSNHGLTGHALVSGNSSSTSSSVGDRREEMLDPNQSIVLLRLRTEEMVPTAGGGKTSKQSTEPRDGLLIWIKKGNVTPTAAGNSATSAQPTAP